MSREQRAESRERNSSLELLRIVAMLMIVIFHFFGYRGNDFPVKSILMNELYSQFARMYGSLGNSIFVLISGYFLVESSGLKYRKLLDLWLRMFFYSVIFFWVFTLSGIQNFSLKEAVLSFIPIPRGMWWFAQTYFVLYLIHPYINILLKSFNQEDYKKFLMAIFFYWSIIPTVTTLEFQGSELITFICLYSLAGYFRLCAKDFGSKKFILYAIFFIVLNFLSVVFLDILSLKFHFLNKHTMYFIGTATSGMMRPFTILAALCFLLGFRKLEIKHNKFINLIASATFGVYLIHVHKFVRPFLWLRVFKNASFQDSPYLIPYSIAVAILVYVACTLIELTRSKIFKLISRGKLS